MAEVVTPAPAPMGDENSQQQQDHHQEKPPALPVEGATAAAAPAAGTERNEKLEIAIRASLSGLNKDLGRLCKTLGEAFCLSPLRPTAAGVAGYDSGSDTTSPADQEHSSSGSETGADHAATAAAAAPAVIAVSGAPSSAEDAETAEVLHAVASAARVRDREICSCRKPSACTPLLRILAALGEKLFLLCDISLNFAIKMCAFAPELGFQIASYIQRSGMIGSKHRYSMTAVHEIILEQSVGSLRNKYQILVFDANTGVQSMYHTKYSVQQNTTCCSIAAYSSTAVGGPIIKTRGTYGSRRGVPRLFPRTAR